jgi:hypothetical protein
MHPKVVVSTLAGAVVTIGWWVAATVDPALKPPVEVVGASVVMVSTGLAYLVPAKDQA